MLKQLVTTATLAAALSLAAIPALAIADEYPGALSTNSSGPGGEITYEVGTGEDEGTPADISLEGDDADSSEIVPASTYTSDGILVGEGGLLSFVITLPESATAGDIYTLTIVAGDFEDEQTIKIAGVPDAVAEPLAAEGTAFDYTPIIWFGAGILLLAVALFLVIRFVRRNA